MNDRALSEKKQELRNRIWDILEKEGVARFPLPPHGRIPNFEGTEKAANQLKEIEVWRDAKVLKCNPDSPQRPVRELALREGKTVYMAVPRLREERCFIELNKKRIPGNIGQATTIRGAFKYGKKVGPEHMKKVDIVVAGSVAVDQKGGRVGKGGGYSDLEYAITRQFGIVDPKTPVISTVHPLQVVEEDIPMTSHDVPLNMIVTTKTVIETPKRDKPQGILWDELNEEKLESLPILMKLRQQIL